MTFLSDEPGASLVEERLASGPRVCTAANWSEAAQRIIQRHQDWAPARALLLRYDLTVEPVTPDDAEVAARLWRRGSGLSLADRLCLVTGKRLGATM